MPSKLKIENGSPGYRHWCSAALGRSAEGGRILLLYKVNVQGQSLRVLQGITFPFEH